MSMLPSEKRLNTAGWICVAYLGLYISLVTISVLGPALSAIRVFQTALQLLMLAAAMASYVNLALLLNGPYRFRRANIPIGIVIAAAICGTVPSIFFIVYSLQPNLQFATEFVFRLSPYLTAFSGIACGILAAALWRLRGVVPLLNRFTEALLFSCFVFLVIRLPVAQNAFPFLILLFFAANAATYITLAGVFFRAARMAKSGWSNALLAQAENTPKS